MTNTTATTTTTKSDVVAELNHLVDRWFLVEAQPGRYETDRAYALRHGEYHRPQYVPTRYGDGWGVAEVTFFLPGTFNAPPKRRRVEIWPEYDPFVEADRLCIEPVE